MCRVSLISPWLTALALLTAVFGVIMVNYLLKLRLRDIWCYNRMNFLRRIFLEGSADEAALFEYVNSPYGPITPYSVTLRKFLASDAGINLVLVASISTIWAVVAIFLWSGTITSYTFVLVGITCAVFIMINVISVRKAYIQATKQFSITRVKYKPLE